MFPEIPCPSGLKPTSRANLGLSPGPALLKACLSGVGYRQEMEARHMLGSLLALQSGAGGRKGVGLAPSSGLHLYSCSSLEYVRGYGNY